MKMEIVFCNLLLRLGIKRDKGRIAQKTLSISFPKEKWDFIVEIKSDDEILLKPVQGSKTNFSLTIVPIPELVLKNQYIFIYLIN